MGEQRQRRTKRENANVFSRSSHAAGERCRASAAVLCRSGRLHARRRLFAERRVPRRAAHSAGLQLLDSDREGTHRRARAGTGFTAVTDPIFFAIAVLVIAPVTRIGGVSNGTVLATRSLSPVAIGRFLVPDPLPERLLYAEPLRRRMRVRFGGRWIADSENVLLLFEPGRYPVAYFRETDVSRGTLQRTEHTSRHPDLGLTSWYIVQAGERSAPRGAWQHI